MSENASVPKAPARFQTLEGQIPADEVPSWAKSAGAREKEPVEPTDVVESDAADDQHARLGCRLRRYIAGDELGKRRVQAGASFPRIDDPILQFSL
jgi:hypothetical protein